jgi:hypothetical protein
MLKEEKYSKYSFVINSVVFLRYDEEDNITMEVLKRLNKQQITFASPKTKNKKI